MKPFSRYHLSQKKKKKKKRQIKHDLCPQSHTFNIQRKIITITATGVGLLLSDVKKKNVKRVVCEVSSRIQLGVEKRVFVSTYGPGSEKSDEEKELFWGKSNECLVS